MLACEHSDVRFVCVGDGPISYKQALHALTEELGVAPCLTWAGSLNNMPAVYNALDILASTSYGESFPNVIGEAMACGVPCVVTDVGDSAIIVDDAGYVVPPKNAEALKTAWATFLDLPTEQRAALGKQARERIVSNYTVQHLVSQTQSALASLL